MKDNKNKMYRVGIYCRTSENEMGNGSMEKQVIMLTRFVKNNGWKLLKVYQDDGYSGLNFERPAFKDMVQDVNHRRINCVITTDLARLSRKPDDCDLYLNLFFPMNKVRYIAVNDQIDSSVPGSCENFLVDNEQYPSEVSEEIQKGEQENYYPKKEF